MPKKVHSNPSKVKSDISKVVDNRSRINKQSQKVDTELSTVDLTSQEEQEEVEKIRKSRSNVDLYLENNVGEKPSKNYDLLTDVRSQKLYKSNVSVRDKIARKYLTEHYNSSQPGSLVPGQMVMFNYFEPQTKEDLEYYDAMPVTIFFGVYNSEQGKRIIGFNLHYYPPRIRMQIMERIFQIWKPFYLKNFNKPLTSDLKFFEYQWLMEQLSYTGLDFGVRQYIPSLCKSFVPIPVEAWAKAIFTEGRFRKESRARILKYWQDKMSK